MVNTIQATITANDLIYLANAFDKVTGGRANAALLREAASTIAKLCHENARLKEKLDMLGQSK